MNILLLGYGKMGKTIEQLALSRHHRIVASIDLDNRQELENLNNLNTDVAIEFSQPEAAVENLTWCINKQIPVVCGTTGWLEYKPALEKLCLEKDSAFFYASNYSIGVNIFFQLNQMLARLMHGHGYEASLTEIHHIHKKDSPSGTAITLAEGIMEHFSEKKYWSEPPTYKPESLDIFSVREGEVPGTHTVHYKSAEDVIEIKHEAFSRQGFALGAVVAAEWLLGRKGVFGMKDLLGL
ncbi:MAG: 4-hydroxy-tetrahydrodipicolinate reductase [Verrucomicrobia bacterium]|nr:4-hydroxy-tetrahydrodipicolinate reductase [Cytophagales bacterium]